MGPDNRFEENPDTNFDTNLVTNGNQTDNSNEKQIDIAGISDENVEFPK